jgi:hypothetical protein
MGVLGYRIFNGTVQIATSSSANYVLTGLTANTNYTFSVKAMMLLEIFQMEVIL